MMLALTLVVIANANAQVDSAKKERKTEMRMMRGGPGGPGGMNMDPKQMADRVTTRLKEKLKLDENQEITVNALALERFQSMKALMAGGVNADNMETIQAEVQKAELKFDTGVKSILKKDQVSLYDDWRKEQEERRRQMMERRMSEMGGN